MNDIKRALGYPLVLALVILALLVLSIGTADAKTETTPLQVYEFLYNRLKEPYQTPEPFETTIGSNPNPNAPDDLFEDGSWRLGDLAGCLLGWDCDNGDYPHTRSTCNVVEGEVMEYRLFTRYCQPYQSTFEPVDYHPTALAFEESPSWGFVVMVTYQANPMVFLPAVYR